MFNPESFKTIYVIEAPQNDSIFVSFLFSSSVSFNRGEQVKVAMTFSLLYLHLKYRRYDPAL